VFIDGTVLAMAGAAADAPNAITATADNAAETARVVLWRAPRLRRRLASGPTRGLLVMTISFDSGAS
jgi:hypothetical protein